MRSRNNQGRGTNPGDTVFCYVRWDTDKRIFAEEAMRIRLVRTLGSAAEHQDCHVAAFCILEDCVHLLLCTDHPEKMKDRDTSHSMLTDEDLYLPAGMDGYTLRESSTGWTVHSGEEAVQFCSDIHLTALRKGYARDLNSYWFSSWQTYRGAYYWNGLHTEEVLRVFSEDRAAAAGLFCKYQKRRAQAVIRGKA